MRLLVLGANGLVGSQVITTARGRGWSVSGTYHTERPAFDIDLRQLDIRDRDRLESVLEAVEPDWVVNAAAMTDVDACERNPETARAVNATAPGTLATLAAERDVGVCHLSTDYVFDGRSDRPYSEQDDPDPVQTYGRSKLAGERNVRAADGKALIARFSFVYGLHGASGALTGFPDWVRTRLESGEETALFTDQRVTPTRAGQAASCILDLVESGVEGTYHVASRSCVTPYEFGVAIRDRLGAPDGTIERGSMTAVDRPARRPAYSCLAVGKLEAELGREQPTLDADLDAIEDGL